MSRRALRWLPAALAPVLVIGVAVAVPIAADAAGGLPQKSAEQVLALVAARHTQPYSGTVSQTSDLGLPSLPTTAAGASAEGLDSTATTTLALLTGTHTARVYVGSSSKARVQLLDSNAERDLVLNGTTAWYWDSATQTAVRTTLTARAESTVAVTPDQLATRILAEVGTDSTVAVDSGSTVAGRAAYDLVVTPKATDTLIGSVRIAVDGATGLPLQVAITAKGHTGTAFAVGFTSLSYGAQPASLFSFTPPSGATVSHVGSGATTTRSRSATKPTVTGSGWDAVITAKVGTAAAKSEAALLDRLTTRVKGGRVLETALVSVLITDDGRVLAGAVPASRLVALAG